MKRNILIFAAFVFVVVVGIYISLNRAKDSGKQVSESSQLLEGIEIQVKEGEYVAINLEINPSTGYKWIADFDEQYLELVNQEYKPRAEGLIGGGGDEQFNFRTLKKGETNIVFSYLREWEEGVPPLDKRIYKIVIR